MNPELIFELEESEGLWWETTIKDYRKRIVKEPKHYAREILEKRGITKSDLQKDFDSVLMSVREEAWQLYLKDECAFHTEVVSHLVRSRDLPKDILKKIVERELFNEDYTSFSKEQLTEKVGKIVGEYTGRVMPYIYALSLSTTQSRRSRAGKTFENIMETFMEAFEIPFENQSSIGTNFYRQNGLGKKVDLIVPGGDEYVKNRSKCAIVTMKTTLRERWQEVAEELTRTNVPHIYLLTLDRGITANVINTIKNYNIALVVLSTEKAKFKDFENVQDFSDFFLKEMPHIVSYWNDKQE